MSTAARWTCCVFTTRPDTVMGVTFVSIAAEHRQRCTRRRTIRNRRAAGRPGSKGSEAELETQEKRGMDTGLRIW